MSLKARLLEEIARDGPMRISDYMDRCLHDPQLGYYATRPALGAEGDFLTAPLVSQMFGEMIAGWVHAVWERMGAPERLALIELGPGDGTLMSDILRALRAASQLSEALDVWLVETSAPLRELQARRVPGARFADKLEDVPEKAPFILVANEFLDCLPIEQAVWRDGAWRERRVGAAGGELAFVEKEVCSAHSVGAYDGAVLERSTAVEEFGRAVGSRLAKGRGAALLIDYGFGDEEFGDTLQALRRHRKESPLASPGEADLTAHVDFAAFTAAARVAGASVAPLETQGGFLTRLGIVSRAESLIRASPGKAEIVGRQLSRLIAPRGMGDLFKVAALASPGVTPP